MNQHVNLGSAVLDEAHVGDIRGALGTIRDHGPRTSWKQRFQTLLAILGPGLIVMVGDNDAGAFGTYTQAGQNYGTSLLWTLLLLVPVLYVNQEMVLRLGAVTGVGHARLILERFGKFWGAFSVIDLFLLNGLTIVTEFIGISLGLGALGMPKAIGVAVAALVIMGAVSTGDFRRFERFALALCAGSLLLVPIFLMVHPPMGRIAHDLLVPHVPAGAKLGDVMLLIIAIVGTTIAPWQLFFQQSYVIDKRITPRFIKYERLDLWFGIVIVVIGAVAMMGFAAAAFAGRPEFGNFTDAAGVAAGLGAYAGRVPSVLFAIALIDASIIGAAAVSLASAYAIGDVLSLKHSLHRRPTDAKGFYAVYCGLILLAAALVLSPGTPLGLLTNAVQALAGVLLPSATVFLLLLCNDRAVLGPWVNTRGMNLFTGAVISVLVTLSVILTVSVLFPDFVNETFILAVFLTGLAIAGLASLFALSKGRSGAPAFAPLSEAQRNSWRMPPLDQLAPMRLSRASRLWMGALRLYLVLAGGLVLTKIVSFALGQAAPGFGAGFWPKLGEAMAENIDVPALIGTLGALAIALVLGTLIGAERQYRQRTAGLRTNALVAVGAAGFVHLGMALNQTAGAGQALAYVISGIGFLGAGVIMKEGTNVRGLNTAATLWCSAAVGAFAGAGYGIEAGLLTIFVLAGNTFLRPMAEFVNRIPIRKDAAEATYQIHATADGGDRDEVRDLLADTLEAKNYRLRELEAIERGDDEVELVATLAATSADPAELDAVVSELEKAKGVAHATWTSTALD